MQSDLDETALKAEIDRISQQIDAILKKVDRLYPPQAPKAIQAEENGRNPDGGPSHA
jgi:hypothetical protein